jgi:glycine/D-amino acid oxidase-like deaminating enzyme
VTSIAQRADEVILQTDSEASINAQKLVFATGYESQAYFKHKVAKLTSTYAIASDPLDPASLWNDGVLIWESARPYLYLRTTLDGRIMAGGEDVPFRDPEARDLLIPEKTERLAGALRRRFPDLQFEIAHAWAGTFAETEDGLAYIGINPEYPRAHFALCYGGNGITFGAAAARIIRDLYFGRENPDAHLFRFDR